MSDSWDEEEIFEKLRDLGVWFLLPFASTGSGYISLNPEDLLRILNEGKVKFLAEKLNVTPEHYAAWVAQMEATPRCHGVNRKGLPCGSYMERVQKLQDFDPAYDIYCRHHKPY